LLVISCSQDEIILPNKQNDTTLAPTSSWQAIDNGILFAKSHYSSVWKPLIFLLLLTGLLLTILLPEDYIQLVVFIIWWLKPFYERLILGIYSECLTGSKISFINSLRKLKNFTFGTSLWRDLTINRISLIRTFRLPVYQLEKQKGEAAKYRLRVLSPAAANRAANLTFLAVHLEMLVSITILSMIWYLIPQEVGTGIFDGSFTGESYVFQLATIFLYCITLLILEPLYVASGFNLYINKRVILEGWDIEIGFKNLVARITN